MQGGAVRRERAGRGVRPGQQCQHPAPQLPDQFRFADLYGGKFAKATAEVTDHLDVLLTFYDFPAEHWVHLRTSNRSSRRLPPSGIESAQDRWRAVDAPYLVAVVRGGARFERDVLVERPEVLAA